MPAKKTIRFITLGCSKNLVDTEKLAAYFNPSFYHLEFTDSKNYADFILINTCGFIHDAKEESINTILEAIELRKAGYAGKIIVWGCLSQRYRNDLQKELSEVDLFEGTEAFQQIVSYISKSEYKTLVGERIVTTPGHYAYLKISEGCNRLCSFCAIPLIRGKLHSLPLNELMIEARMLAGKGVKELILIAQDLTSYGLDLNGKSQITKLVQSLSTIKGIDWIRLHYAYPYKFPEDLLIEMRDNSKVCKYLDIPFQHISNHILKSMRRGITGEQTYSLIEKIRKFVPEITIRTTIMTGFPGETEEEFQELCDFVEKVKFNRLGVFTYSEEEGTFAARELQDDLPQKVKQERLNILMEIQRNISLEYNQAMIGKEFRVMIDGKSGKYYVGRTESDSPEVDNQVYVKARYLMPGEFYQVKIDEAQDYDIFGKLV
ncbi:MAG: 30S ribosomal protein S12 methylthiotransferase RimO [Bacteroidetes bacterium HGW-Bacteroidetes-21]|jgi:ribosomal protein S12 methylthiotransferase|nr:MAG: 30S ribosomal protein S12 methylthiotransferase RimO [Bacteroidetes bacterium HGW-Bacteroidetes-21]